MSISIIITEDTRKGILFLVDKNTDIQYNKYV